MLENTCAKIKNAGKYIRHEPFFEVSTEASLKVEKKNEDLSKLKKLKLDLENVKLELQRVSNERDQSVVKWKNSRTKEVHYKNQI